MLDAIRTVTAVAWKSLADDALAALRPLRGAAPRAAWPWRDIAVAALLMALAAVVHAGLALRLAQGGYALYDNLGFDWDPSHTLMTLVGTPPAMQGIKHPLIILLRPLAWPFLAAGLGPVQAAGLVMVIFSAGMAGVVYGFLRSCRIARPEAAALGLLFLSGGTSIFTAIVPETYGPAAFSIALAWLVARRRMDDPARWRRGRYLAALLVFGVTITNVMQPLIAETAVAWRRGRLLVTAGRMAGFAVGLGALAVLVAAIVWSSTLWHALLDPVQSVKEIYWLDAQGARTGPGAVLATFFGYAFVSPGFTTIPLPEGIDMLDFRSLPADALGLVTLGLWLGFWAVGAVAGLRNAAQRPIALALLAAVLANVAFHLEYQFRGSLYLYTGHVYFPIFALGAGLAPGLAKARWMRRGAYIGVVLVLAGLAGTRNLGMAADFVTRFDTVRATHACTVPCATPLRLDGATVLPAVK